ncbi:DsbC family protein [Aquabacterium sp.]|uniref:DsbC family protein n=1 Tax=Aquabacterium sp. TaxID=1872578 RepID=UPI0025C33775|nr:DsbC family protein [Aquabacterium sp.]
MTFSLRAACLAALLASAWPMASVHAQAGELPAAQLAVLKQKLAQRLPDLPPVDGARTAPVPGLIELRAGGNVFYTDANGDYLIEGQVLETRTQRNLTEERLDEINKVDFDKFPLKDAVVWKNGNGKRRMVVFADPNCGYCKQLEKDLIHVKDVTVYTFVIPILGADSKAKAEAILCLKDRTQAWRDWMTEGTPPARVFGNCASPAQRNLALANSLRVNATPALFFEDGSRVVAALPATAIEQRLVKALGRKGG